MDHRDDIKKLYRAQGTGDKVYIPAKPKISLNDRNRVFRTCAYCRVSTGSDEQLFSYELQQAHYRQVARERPNWDLRHIYADEGISGTSLKNRAQFNEMIAACERGEYDLIVTKSVSRFARNLIDCVSLIRRLKKLEPPVGVFFETDGLNTLDENSDLMLTFLAKFAEEESVKKREAMIWSLTQRFKDEKALTPPLLGYDRQKDADGRYVKYAPLVINREEAKIVRFIFGAYLSGKSVESIAAFLTDIGCQTKTGSVQWSTGSIRYILSNERYCGDILTWKTFTSDLFDHTHRKNRSDREQWHLKNKHEAIISRKEFELVQALLQNKKHHIQGSLPGIHVIDEGIFRGFVPINHHWVNEEPGPYFDSSNSVRKKGKQTRIPKKSFSAFDLTGYQVVRNQFTQMRYNGPALTVSKGRMTFNTWCVRKFADVGYIQLLLHASERKLAIRPSSQGATHSIRWRAEDAAGIYSKSLSCPHFGAALFEIMGWDPDYVYKVRGNWMTNGDERIIIFNLCAAVGAVFVEVPLEEGIRKQRAEFFPEEWEGRFGDEFYDHIVENDFYYLLEGDEWKSGKASIPAPGIEQFSTPSEEEVKSLAKELIKEAANTYGGSGGA